MIEVVNPSEYLREAIDRLDSIGWRKMIFEEDIWGKRSLPSELPGECLMEAVWQVTDRAGKSKWGPIEYALRDAIRWLFPDRGGIFGYGVNVFNDHPDTTYQDVTDVCVWAIGELEQQEVREWRERRSQAEEILIRGGYL